MNLKLLIVLGALCLSACGTTTLKDDAPASDLDVYVSNVKREAKPVLLPNGRDYCMELSKTEDAQDDCGGDLEDALFAVHMKLKRIVDLTVTFTDRLRLMRNPCSRWEKIRRAPRCR